MGEQSLSLLIPIRRVWIIISHMPPIAWSSNIIIEKARLTPEWLKFLHVVSILAQSCQDICLSRLKPKTYLGHVPPQLTAPALYLHSCAKVIGMKLKSMRIVIWDLRSFSHINAY